MNQIILVGNVGSVDMRPVGNTGEIACNFTVATEHRWKDKSGEWKGETTWHRCIKFLKHESDAPKKGEKVFVEGSINNRSYEDKNGEKKHVTEIKVKNFFSAPRETMAPLPVAPMFDNKGAFSVDEIPF